MEFLNVPAQRVNIIDLANFWNDVLNQNKDRFSDKVLCKFFVLNYAPNSMWTYFISVYYMSNKNDDGMLEDNAFADFLDITTAFIWAYTITNPGVNALRTPIYSEMVNIVEHKKITFEDWKFDKEKVQKAFDNFFFGNNRTITKSMLAWWTFVNPNQKLLSLETVFEIEHIYAKNRQYKEQGLINKNNLESLGNKSILEKRINIRASDYRFEDKVKYYKGFMNGRGQFKEGTRVQELLDMVSKQDFNEKDIEMRYSNIIDDFLAYLVSAQ